MDFNTNNTTVGADKMTPVQELSKLRECFNRTYNKLEQALLAKFYCEDRIMEMHGSLIAKIEESRTNDTKRKTDEKTPGLEITDICECLEMMNQECSRISQILDGCSQILTEERDFANRMMEIFINEMNK